jgi:hypothetical protein
LLGRTLTLHTRLADGRELPRSGIVTAARSHGRAAVRQAVRYRP